MLYVEEDYPPTKQGLEKFVASILTRAGWDVWQVFRSTPSRSDELVAFLFAQSVVLELSTRQRIGLLPLPAGSTDLMEWMTLAVRLLFMAAFPDRSTTREQGRYLARQLLAFGPREDGWIIGFVGTMFPRKTNLNEPMAPPEQRVVAFWQAETVFIDECADLHIQHLYEKPPATVKIVDNLLTATFADLHLTAKQVTFFAEALLVPPTASPDWSELILWSKKLSTARLCLGLE